MRPSRTRHLIFLAHLWACVPFLVAWMAIPSTHAGIPRENFQKITVFLWFVIGYLLVRTWLAWKDKPQLAWEYIYPPIDVLVVSVLIWLGSRDPLSNIALLYFFPIAQTSGTLNLRWTVAVAAMILVGAALATHGLRSEEPFNAIFRYFFIFVLGSLVTSLARASASLREQLAIARERNRIAMEMHDGVQGHLVAASRQLELLEHIAPKDGLRAAGLAGEALESTTSAAAELRYLVNRMRSPSLDEGFVSALKAYVHNLLSRHGLEYTFEVQGEEGHLPGEAEHAAFRIAQEALANVVRHAHATRVGVRVSYWKDMFELCIEDDGIGFDSVECCPGLDGMKARAHEVGGTMEIYVGSGERNPDRGQAAEEGRECLKEFVW